MVSKTAVYSSAVSASSGCRKSAAPAKLGTSRQQDSSTNIAGGASKTCGALYC